MKDRIFPTVIYPIGELPGGVRLCASVGRHGFDYFPEFVAFDEEALDDPWVIEIDIDDAAPTLKDEDVQALGSHAEWFWN